MKNAVVVTLLLSGSLFAAFITNADQPSQSDDMTAASSANMEETAVDTTQGTGSVVFKAEGATYSVEVSDEHSELKFYSAESSYNVDAACEIVSEDENQSVDIIIEGLGKGKDVLQGSVDIGQTQSVAQFKDGDTLFSFTEGTIEIVDFSKETGVVKVKVTGICSKKVGNSFSGMTLDLPAEMEVDVVLSNIRTFGS